MIGTYASVLQSIPMRQGTDGEKERTRWTNSWRSAISRIAFDHLPSGQMPASIEEAWRMLANLQAGLERDKARLAREIHDDLGGLLLAASMDVDVLGRRVATLTDGLAQSIARLKQMLAEAVDLTRRMTEELRPTLLDTFGLFTAVRSQLKCSCLRAGVAYTEEFPETEIPLSAAASIAVFRIAQEVLVTAFCHPSVTAVHFSMRTDHDVLILQVSDDGVGEPLDPPQAEVLASVRQRTRGLGGDITTQSLGKRGTTLTASIPLSAALALH